MNVFNVLVVVVIFLLVLPTLAWYPPGMKRQLYKKAKCMPTQDNNDNSGTNNSNSSQLESAEEQETVEQRHFSLTNTDNGTKSAIGSNQPKGFISTLKRNSLNMTSTVRNSNSGGKEEESGDGENGGETGSKAEEEKPRTEVAQTRKEKRTKVKPTVAKELTNS